MVVDNHFDRLFLLSTSAESCIESSIPSDSGSAVALSDSAL